MENKLTFENGIWAAIQHVAVDQKLPEVAKCIAKDLGITYFLAKQMQSETDYFNGVMEQIIISLKP